jgi:hypothetical protein
MHEVCRLLSRSHLPDRVVTFDAGRFLVDDDQPVSPAFIIEMDRRDMLEWAPGVDPQWVRRLAERSL